MKYEPWLLESLGPTEREVARQTSEEKAAIRALQFHTSRSRQLLALATCHPVTSGSVRLPRTQAANNNRKYKEARLRLCMTV